MREEKTVSPDRGSIIKDWITRQGLTGLFFFRARDGGRDTYEPNTLSTLLLPS